MVATIDGGPVWRCSGTLIAPTVFVTAGHCTYGVNGAQLWFETDLEDPGPASYGYPFIGDVSGLPYTMPGHTDNTWFLYDLGVVRLNSPVYPGGYPGTYATLPAPNALDELGHGRNKANVTAVGYGLQEFVEGPMCVGPEDCDVGAFFDPKYRADKTRYQADLMVVNTTGVAGLGNLTGSTDQLSGSFLVSGDSKHGGTCFGDSGGPMLIGNVLMGVNSFGLNRNCAGVGGAFRVDQPTSLDFISPFLP